MARWTGTWLTGPGSAGVQLRSPDDYRGRRLGLPEQGPGSAAGAGSGARIGAFVVDVLLAALVGGLVNTVVSSPTDLQRNLSGSLAFAVLTFFSTLLVGQTPGMRLTGLRVLPLADRGSTPGLLPAALRTALLLTFVLALVVDRDGRGLHDRAAGTVVVRT